MATRATFDLPRAESVKAVTNALDDLHEVSWRVDDPPDDNASGIGVFISQTPLWAYPLAAAVVIGPWLTASLAGWARFSTAGGEGLELSTEFEGTTATLMAVVALVAVVVSFTIGWWIVTKFKRPVGQATVTATSDADDTVTDLVLTGSPDRYIHLTVQRVFDTHDRDAIAKREAEGEFSITDFLGLGGGGGAMAGRAGGLGALFGGPGPQPSPEPAPSDPTDADSAGQAPVATASEDSPAPSPADAGDGAAALDPQDRD